ncbi:MAG: hypothetical protein WC476_13045 [Phycisphaerae bacterium]
MISISICPGGNPVALENPETMATVYMRCKKCGTHYCDRCLKKMGGLFKKPACGKCGGGLTRGGPDEANEIMTGQW